MVQQIARGLRNNNPLNIRQSLIKWVGLRPNPTDKDFEEFESMIYGIRAAMVCMRTHCIRMKRKHESPTVQALISIWAPSTENDTKKYVQVVCRISEKRLTPTTVIDPSNKARYCLLVWAMAYFETGARLDYRLFEQAYEML